MSVKEYFEKAGGLSLLKQYLRNGVFFTAGAEVVLLGFSKKSLEQMRIVVQNKVCRKLYKKYDSFARSFCAAWDTNVPHEQCKKVWVCWLQGIENAPLLVQRCYESYKTYMSDGEIVVLTEDNIKDYVEFPGYIMEKYKKGIITRTHFSDLLRAELLSRYGGTWMDATVLCTGANIPEYMLDSELFFFQQLKPGADGKELRMSSWMISAYSNHPIMALTRALLYEYWKTHDYMMDYFLFHAFVTMACSYYEKEYKEIVDASNSIPHILLLRFFEKFDEKRWEYMKQATPFHKLSYKFDEKQMDKRNTYYDEIIVKNRK